MKTFLANFYYSFPIQLLLLHFRKTQILLVFWLILFLTITGNFMKLFGANTLFLSPEYLGTVNPAGAAIVGVAIGVFIMSWNITTFIMHSNRFRFLATTSKPFLKYCLNNAIIPIVFLLVYFGKTYNYATHDELIPFTEFLLIVLGFCGGLFLLLLISFAYFFTADRRIIRNFKPRLMELENRRLPKSSSKKEFGLPVRFYLNSYFRFKQARRVDHYSLSFLDDIFKRHHFSAMATMLMAFIFMILIAFFLDDPIFQVPAAASILILFAILTAVIGALSYFLKSWTILFVIGIYLILNILYQYNIIDPRNKAYGLDYSNKERPAYTLQNLQRLNSPEKVEADKTNMIQILENWKKNQSEEKPLMVVFNFSGGGLRGASFSMDILQNLDSLSEGTLMKKTFLMTGASGGMLAAAYYRQLSLLKNQGEQIDLYDEKYVDNISEDLLNPVFSAMIARDLIAPVQKFSLGHNRYTKDRGYAFEQKLNENTGGILDKDLNYFKQYESRADIPLMILNSVITRDFKKLVIGTQPMSFMMQSEYKDSSNKMVGPDAIDFSALFKNEEPMNLRMLTALRMNASYPYVLPGVWLPSDPVIDVMDAGLKDNTGQEASLRFLYAFKDWINTNTSGILIIQIRSRQKGSWGDKFENGGIQQMLTRPMTMMQTNLFMLQDYIQNDEFSYIQDAFKVPLNRVAFMYIPEKEESGATVNFHLTAIEKMEVKSSLNRANNQEAFKQILQIWKAPK